MSVQVTQEAPYPTKQDVLNLIPRRVIESLFRHIHLKREKVIGFIGLRGEGKSAGCACLALIDYMLWGKKVWSNIEIKRDFEISDEMARKYGLESGGVSHFASEPLDKQALLKLDDSYRGGCLVIEEINVQYSNVRRSMANTNVDFNMVVQEIRHLETSLIYNVIDEMFIDSQLRSLTDAFIKVEDTAYDQRNLAMRKEPGRDFKWLIYPMSPAFAGREQSYYITKKPLSPVYFHFLPFRGIYDDKVYQHKGTYSESRKEQGSRELPLVSAESSDEMIKEVDEWGWIAERARELRDGGVKAIKASDLWQHLGIAELGISPLEVGKRLPIYGIVRDRWSPGIHQYIYRVEVFKLENKVSEPIPA